MAKLKLKLSDILIKGAKIEVKKLPNTKEVRNLIAETIKQQEFILSLKPTYIIR